MLAALVALAACEMDLYRSDTMTSANFKTNPGAAVYSTDGNYAMLKDEVEFNMNNRGGFNRIYFLMSELRGDNTSLSAHTTDPLCHNATYEDEQQDEDLSYMWYICYKVIYGCNTNISTMPEGESVETDHLLGENYFLRAYCHFSLCNLFATPYSRGADKPGIIIRNSTDFSVTERATVGKVYEQIEKDLLKAMALMEKGTRRGNAGYASYDAAKGLLTRLYLYMGKDKECADLCDEMLGAAPESHLDDITKYFNNAKDSHETLWCIARIPTDPSYDNPKGQIASIYYTSMENDGGDGAEGWCELYWSDPLIDLMMRNPNDKRFTTFFRQYGCTNDGLKMITWPKPAEDFHLNHGKLLRVKYFDFDVAEQKITVETDIWSYKPVLDDNGEQKIHDKGDYKGEPMVVRDQIIGVKDSLTAVTIYRQDVNGYPVYYRKDLYTDAEDKDDITGGSRVYVRENADITVGFRDRLAPKYGMTKFCFQDGKAMLSSPVVLRWAEIILNRAEARAKQGDVGGALADVNVIRARAGIDPINAVPAGYDILDVVLEERRMELCFEGHRAIDVYRNGKDLDRRYGGYQYYEVLTPEDMDVRYPYCIPFGETSVSGIPANQKQL